jgi:hypothetical protein
MQQLGVQPDASDDTALDYVRGIETSLRYWYQEAETKAQVALTINAAFLAFLTGSILASPDQLSKTIEVFGPETWVFLVGMAVGLSLSIACAVVCLAARGVWSARAVNDDLTRYQVDPAKPETYAPEIAASFVLLARLDPDRFAEWVPTVDRPAVVRALATDLIRWSKNIAEKHKEVNISFLWTAVTLGFFLSTGVSYVIRISLAT